MSKKIVRAKYLRKATALLLEEWEKEAEEESLPLSASNEFQSRMRTLLQEEQKTTAKRHYYRSRILATAAMIVMVIFAWFAFNPTARAGVAEWFKTVFQGATQYRFEGEIRSRELPNYRLGWYPEGGRIAHEDSGKIAKDYTITILYEDGEKLMGVLGFTYGFFDSGTVISIDPQGNELVSQIVKVKNWTIEEHYTTNLDEYDYYWMDNENQIYFLIYSTFDRQTNLKIINSIMEKGLK